MNAFRVIRRALWSIILAASITLGCAYLAFSQVFLTSAGLTHIIKQSNIVEIIRTDVLLPKVLETAKTSDHSALLDDKTITQAFDATITNQALTTKFAPAIESLSLWLNSKEPSVKFSIDLTDLADKFADQLAASASAKIASLPQCTLNNTFADAQNGICRSSLVSSDTVTKSVSDTLKNDPSLKQTLTVQPETVPALSSAKHGSVDLPSYLNLFYSLSLVAAGVIVLITLWLLFKHRLSGIITIGAACILAAIALYGMSLALAALTASTAKDALAHNIASTATLGLRTALQQQALLLVIGGGVAIILAALLLVFLARRRNAQTIHMSRPQRETSEQTQHKKDVD